MERFFFLHMQKTAGTALWMRMLDAFPREWLYPHPDDGPKPDVTLLTKCVVDAFARRGDEIRIVTGHFPLCTTELLGGGFHTFTVLREPVERALSSLRHYRARTPGMADVPLDEIYDDPWRRLVIVNHMTKMLSLTVEEMTGDLLTDLDMTADHVDRAKAALHGIEVVGLQERFEEFCTALSTRYGWDLGPPRVANRTPPAPASDALVERIRADNAADIELYRYAVDLAV